MNYSYKTYIYIAVNTSDQAKTHQLQTMVGYLAKLDNLMVLQMIPMIDIKFEKYGAHQVRIYSWLDL